MKIIHYKQLASTNSHIKELLQSDYMLPHFTVVSADYQTSGRGQRENRWESCEGANLLFSILLRPDELKASDAFAIINLSSYMMLRGKDLPLGSALSDWRLFVLSRRCCVVRTVVG